MHDTTNKTTYMIQDKVDQELVDVIEVVRS